MRASEHGSCASGDLWDRKLLHI